MRSNKGLGRFYARKRREEKEESAVKDTTPKQLRRLHNATRPHDVRAKKIVVGKFAVDEVIAELGLRRCTANKRRKLLKDIRGSK